jgi:hypothetical protein
MSLGVVRYYTPEGGEGYIANSSLPWLSSYNVTQQAPVYDQETAWLRNSQPGSFTNYSRFGAPYSLDGGVLPPYADGFDEPVPYDTSSGMGDLVLLRQDVVAPMPSITSTARSGCSQASGSSESFLDALSSGDIGSWMQGNPWLVAAIAAGVTFLLFGGKR